MIQNGNLIRLNLNGSLIAKLMALDLSVEREMLDKTDKYTDGWKAVEPGNKSFSVSCEGYLVNPYDKNMIVYSENFSHSSWVRTGCDVSPTLVTDPNGFKRAYRTSGASVGDTISVVPISSANGVSYTFSVWVKSVTGTVDIDLNLTNGTNTGTQAITATTTWTRYSVSVASTVAASLTCQIAIDQTAEIEIFGAQLEFGTSATTYEPTGIRFTELFNAAENGTAFTAEVTDATTGNKKYSGTVYVSSLSLTAPQGQLCTFSCELTGTANLSETTI